MKQVPTVKRKAQSATAKRENRDVEIPPIARDDFFEALKKATRKREKK